MQKVSAILLLVLLSGCTNPNYWYCTERVAIVYDYGTTEHVSHNVCTRWEYLPYGRQKKDQAPAPATSQGGT